jgi:type I restriction enzyme S subunit
VTPAVPLGSVLTKSDNWIQIDPLSRYTELTVHLWGRGVSARRTVEGSEITGQRRLKVLSGEFVVSRIDARHGAFAVIPDDLDGAVVSNDFPALRPNPERLLPEYLGWLSRTPDFVGACRAASEGTTNRVRLKEEKFAQIKIPLPPLPEQWRIVAKIERLAAKIDEARGTHALGCADRSALFQSALHRIWRDQKGWSSTKIGDVVRLVSGQVNPLVEPYASMPHLNGEVIESHTGRLLETYRLAKEDGVISGKYPFKAGSVLYSKIRPYLRKAAIVPFDGICSADVYATESIDPGLIPGFFKYTLLSPMFSDYADEKSGRTRMPKLNQKQLLTYEMKFPSVGEQHRIVAYLDRLQARVDGLKVLQAQTRAELDALLPSILDRAFKGEL